MQAKIKFIEINYHFHGEFTNPADVMTLHGPSNLFTGSLKERAEIVLVKHLNYEGETIIHDIQYYFSKSRNRFVHIPFSTHRYVSYHHPQMVLVQGFIFPLHVMALRRKIGKDPVILLQHQGEVPFRRKKLFQKWADHTVDGYVFTSKAMAPEWIRAGIIAGMNKCFELPPASTTFTRLDKKACQLKLGMNGYQPFLWVGRLNANKDPITVLEAFDRYAVVNQQARLYVIYQEDDLLEKVRQRIAQSVRLQEQVRLIGPIAHEELPVWYSATDYFILASHREGGSYALMEALACGAVPIVSRIPASMKMIGQGKAGYYFDPGNIDQLSELLQSLNPGDYAALSAAAENMFREHLSASAIADKLFTIYEQLKRK